MYLLLPAAVFAIAGLLGCFAGLLVGDTLTVKLDLPHGALPLVSRQESKEVYTLFPL